MRVLAGHRLPETGQFGPTDPFVVARVGTAEYRTDVVHGNPNPVWNSRQFVFPCDLRESDKRTLQLEASHKNFQGAEALGRAAVDITGLPPGQVVRRRERLDGQGELELELLFLPEAAEAAAPPLPGGWGPSPPQPPQPQPRPATRPETPSQLVPWAQSQYPQGALGPSAAPEPAGPCGAWAGFGGEAGPRHWVVMCKDDVEIRATPTYADDARVGHFLQPGQVVAVDERRALSGALFLRLADGRGWVFETKDRLLVMTQAHDFQRGLWHYGVVCEDDVETRIAPTYSDDARTGIVLGSGDCFAVDERCVVAGAMFLKLADGRGWVFETKDRLLVMSELRAKAQEARDFERGLWHYSVVCDDDVEIRAGPTYSDEARTGLMVYPGDCVTVDERCRMGSTWFLRLSDGRGWIFETKDSRRVMMQLH